MTNYELSVCDYIIKAIEELYFEDLVDLVEGERLTFKPKAGVEYSFTGKFGAFDNLWINKKSFEKTVNGEIAKLSVEDFIIEIQSITQMDDITQAQFIEEANQTLFGDMLFLENFEKVKGDLISKNFHDVDSILPGHPKIMNNKGRLGWSAQNLESFAPETSQSFKLHWIAASKEQSLIGGSELVYLENAFSKEEIQKIAQDIDLDRYIVFPVHPWQWDRYIRIQYADLIDSRELISLGVVGPVYGPQTSIRTLSNLDTPLLSDMKLSVSILNTSIVRGIPRRFIENGHEVSELVDKVTKEDSFLEDRVRIAKEVGAVSVTSNNYEGLEGAPPRFKELLGCICRESVPFLLKEDESAIPIAALFFKQGDYSFIKELIDSSSLDAESWMKTYFENVVIPLYHLQMKHGVGMVAHGQNVVLILKDKKPYGVILKDFHGDLRLSSTSHLIGNHSVSSLTVLPPEYLIHDLYTGHFVTVLRYISRVMEEFNILREEAFYKLLGDVVENYFEQGLINRPEGPLNLLREEVEKLQVNKVRFVMGYKESTEPLKPLVGKNIKNPLVKYRNWSLQ